MLFSKSHDIQRSAPCRALEKQFHLPAVLIDGRDGRRAEGQQVGEEHDGLLFLRVPYLYPSEQHWLLSLPLQLGKADDLVAHHVAVLWNLQFFFHLVNRLLLHPRHEVHFLLRQFPKPLVVVVAAVNDQDRPRSEPQRARHLDLAGLAFGHHRERRQVAIVVQQQVQLDRALGPPKFRPVEHAHRQVDDAPVQTHQLVLETEFLPPTLALHQLLALQQRLLEHGLVKLPRSMFIGVGQRGLLGCHRHPQILQLPLAARQSTTDLAQRMRPAQLAKQHRHELTPTGETRTCRSALCSFTAFSNSPRENSFNTCEKMLHTFIRLSLLWLSWSFRNPIPPYQELSLSPGRRSPLRPAVSPLIWTAMSSYTPSSRSAIRTGSPMWAIPSISRSIRCA